MREFPFETLLVPQNRNVLNFLVVDLPNIPVRFQSVHDPAATLGKDGSVLGKPAFLKLAHRTGSIKRRDLSDRNRWTNMTLSQQDEFILLNAFGKIDETNRTCKLLVVTFGPPADVCQCLRNAKSTDRPNFFRRR